MFRPHETKIPDRPFTSKTKYQDDYKRKKLSKTPRPRFYRNKNNP